MLVKEVFIKYNFYKNISSVCKEVISITTFLIIFFTTSQWICILNLFMKIKNIHFQNMVVVAVRVSFSIALEHDGKKPYQCSICDDTFTGPGTDYSHQLTQLSRFEFELESTRRQHHLKNHYSSIYTYQSKVHQKINQLRVPIKKSHGIKCRSDIEHSEIDNIISFEISAYTLNSLIPYMTFLKGPVLVRQDRSVKYCSLCPVRPYTIMKCSK